jgi:hypothetical protein
VLAHLTSGEVPILLACALAGVALGIGFALGRLTRRARP